ncbi:MAG: hypothetical protein AB7S38_17970 [Vulcanimicrobiota bacterium]
MIVINRAANLGKANDIESLKRLKEQAARQEAEDASARRDQLAAGRELSEFDRLSAFFKKCQGSSLDQAGDDPKKVVLDDVPMLNIASAVALGTLRALSFGYIDHPGLKARITGVAEFDDSGNLTKLDCETRREGMQTFDRSLMMQSPYSESSGEYHAAVGADGSMRHQHRTDRRDDLVFRRESWNIEGSPTKGYDFQYTGNQSMPRGWAWSGFNDGFQGHGHLDPTVH